MSARRAMTILEILAVVVILGMLAVALTVGLAGKVGRAKTEIARSQVARLAADVEAYHLARGSWPAAGAGLEALAADPQASYFVEPARLVDPWGNPYRYLTPGPDGRPFEVLSYGADGRAGGEGENADISSARLEEVPSS